MNATQIQSELKYFKGTTTYTKHLFPGLSPIMLTDGCKYIREKCNGYWLFDAILSYQTEWEVKHSYYQVWRLEKQKDDTWLLSCEDGHGKVILTQKIEYSDFPIRHIAIWIHKGVAFLPREY